MDPVPTVGTVQPPGPQEINPAKYHFSAEELRTLRECNVESFYQRSLPIGTALGVAAWAAVKKGLLKGSPKYGPIPKVALGVVVGYFAGKFSYQGKCAEKIMRLPNSPLGEMLRKRRHGGSSDGFPMAGAFGLTPSVTPDTDPDKNYNNRQTSLDMDVSRPSMSGLDDGHRPNLDSPINNFDDNLPLDPPKNGTTYDELRRAHREEYQRRMNAGAGQPANPGMRRLPDNQPMPAPQTPQQQPGNYQQDEPVVRSQQKNKYGDVWT